MKTLAEQFFENPYLYTNSITDNGLRYLDKHTKRLELDDENGAQKHYLEDDSIIIANLYGEDIGFKECFCMQGAGHHPDCENQSET